jgi:hypothetical protein
MKENTLSYTFYPYKHQRNFGGHCHGYSVLFGEQILNFPSISVEKIALIGQEILILQQKT